MVDGVGCVQLRRAGQFPVGQLHVSHPGQGLRELVMRILAVGVLMHGDFTGAVRIFHLSQNAVNPAMREGNRRVPTLDVASLLKKRVGFLVTFHFIEEQGFQQQGRAFARVFPVGAVDQVHGFLVLVLLDQFEKLQVSGIVAVPLGLVFIPQGDVHSREPGPGA